MKVFELAKKLNKKSKEILDAAEYLKIKVKSHLSTLNEDEVKQIIKYFRKRRFFFFFKRYSLQVIFIFLATIVFFIFNPRSVVSGEIEASFNKVGELIIDWEFEDSIEEGAILIESESELLIIEIDESIGSITECCFEEDLNILLLITDEADEIVEVESINLNLSNESISTTSSSTTTSTPISECNDEVFNPYTLYDSEGNGNTVTTCKNEKEALDSGYTNTVNPNPPPSATTTTTSTTTTTKTTTTTTTIPDPSSTVTQSLGSCSGPSGTRTSTLSITNNGSETLYYLVEQTLNDGALYTTESGNTNISAGSSFSFNQVVPDGLSIIWRYKESSTSGDFSNSSYVTLSASDTVDCPDGYYVNVDGSNTYALTVECRKWNNTTKVRFQANPWWGNYNLAKDYMFALIALTGDYDNGDSNVDVEDYFDYSQFTCGVVPGAYFAYQKGFVQFIGQAITAPSWNSTTDVEDGSSDQRDFYIFSELVP